jgi:hypothetical protein
VWLGRGLKDIEAPGFATGAHTVVATATRAKAARRTSISETVSQKPALETGADFRVKSPHCVNGDRYRIPRMARNGAHSATTRHSEWETRLVGCGPSRDRTGLQPCRKSETLIISDLAGNFGRYLPGNHVRKQMLR